MMFNIIGSLRPECEIRLLITSAQKIPVEAPHNCTAKNLGKEHASTALPAVIKEVRRFRPQYLFTTSSSIGYMLIIAKYCMPRSIRPKVVIRCAVPPSESYFHGLRSQILRKIIRFTYCGADCIIAQTEFMRRDLMEAYGLQPDKVLHIRNIIHASFLDEKAGAFVPEEYNPHNYNIIAAGALYSVKGFDILIKAFASLDFHSHLFIIGRARYENDYENQLKDIIHRLGLDNRVHLLGHKNNPYPYIKNANLLVMSSRKEGFPNVVLEALHLGTPVIATDCVDWTGVIEEGINGFVVPKSNIEAISKALIQAKTYSLDTKKIKIGNYDYNQLFK